MNTTSILVLICGFSLFSTINASDTEYFIDGDESSEVGGNHSVLMYCDSSVNEYAELPNGTLADTMLLHKTLNEMVAEEHDSKKLPMARMLGRDATKKKVEKKEAYYMKKSSLDDIKESINTISSQIRELHLGIQQNSKTVVELNQKKLQLESKIAKGKETHLNKKSSSAAVIETLAEAVRTLENRKSKHEAERERLISSIEEMRGELNAKMAILRNLTKDRDNYKKHLQDLEADFVKLDEGLARLGLHYRGSVAGSIVYESHSDNQSTVERLPEDQKRILRMSLERARTFNPARAQEVENQSGFYDCVIL